MSQRRMFSKDITENDAFLDMPLSSQALYFHLGMQADDDGFVTPNRVVRMLGAQQDDLKLLVAKKFVIAFEDGVVVIKHWKINNYIQKDRYKATTHQEKMALLSVKDNNGYKLDTECIQNVRAGKVSIGKESIVKVSKGKYGEFQNVQLSEEEYIKLCDLLGENNTLSLIDEMSEYLASSGKRYKSHYAALRNWARRKIQDYQKGKGNQIAEI